MRLFRGDDGSQPLLAPNDNRSTIGRPGGRTVVVAVVREASRLSVQIDDEEVAALVDIFVALVQVRDHGQRARIRAPGDILHVDAEVRDRPRWSPAAWDDVELRGRRR